MTQPGNAPKAGPSHLTTVDAACRALRRTLLQGGRKGWVLEESSSGVAGGEDIPHPGRRGSQEEAAGVGGERKLHEVPAGRSHEQEEEKEEIVPAALLSGLSHAQELTGD